MTEVPDPDAATSPPSRPPRIGTSVLRFTRQIVARSAHNRHQTLALMARRRLWRPALYPRLDWLAWLCYSAALVAVVAMVIDVPVGSFGRRWPEWLVHICDTATKVGLSGWYLFPAAFICIVVNLLDWSKRRGWRLLVLYNWTNLGVFVLLSVGVPGLIATFFKHFIGRARPFYFAEMGAFSFEPFAGSSSFASMPSGHSTTVGSLAAILVLLVPASRFVVIPLALGLAMTRVVLYSHYPSDVVAGLALGSGCTVLVALVFARLGYIFTARDAGLPTRRNSFSVFW